MRLDFNVLCIDDQPEHITGAIEDLKFHVEEEGFRLDVQYARSLGEAVARIADDVFRDVIDLVLVDYDLGTGSGGEQALVRVKHAMPYKDVVFYSARSTEELRELVYKARVEGVFCASRTNLGEVVTGVFEALVKKVLDIDHSRGIILGATSDLDHLVNEILRSSDGHLTVEQRSALLKYALKKIDKKLKRFDALRQRLGEEPTIDALLEAHELFTSMDRLSLLIRVHDHRYTKRSPFRTVVSSYMAKIPSVRNMLGHVRLLPGQQHKALTGIGNEVVDPATLREVRKELIRVRNEFEEFAARGSE